MSREWMWAMILGVAFFLLNVACIIFDGPETVEVSSSVTTNVFFATALIITAIDRRAKK